VNGRRLIVCLLALTACADDATTTPGDTTGSARIATTTTAITTTTTVGSIPLVSAGTTETVAPPSSPSTIADPPTVGNPAVTAAAIGEFDQPLGLTVRPGDEALYIIEKPGRVIRFDGGTSTTVLDVSTRISTNGERGLLGLTFSPDGSLGYVNFTDPAGDTTIVEYEVASNGTFDPRSERLLLVVEQPYGNHNAGDLTFGPDDMLYIPLGDGGSANDPERRAGDPTSLLGSLLRIDPTPTSETPYSIPPDNPFATGARDGVDGAPEIWSWGLRNPWRVEFDPITGALWISDVGQNDIEEINYTLPADGAPPARGTNFGWSAYEGDQRFNDDVDDPGNTVFPVLTYRHGDDGCSISGGVPYRGSDIPELEPAYVYGDYCSGKLWALDLDGGRNLLLLDGFDDLASVRAGPGGELYVIELSGTIHRLMPG